METAQESQKSEKSKSSKSKNFSLVKKLDPASAKLLSQLAEKANRKDFGRRILERDILSVALKLINEAHLKELQQQSLTERDRLNIAHDQYQKSNGKITMDQFIGKLIRGEISIQKENS